jgi:hypothetical protein
VNGTAGRDDAAREAFITRWCRRMGVLPEKVRACAEPCDCAHPTCAGWAMNLFALAERLKSGELILGEVTLPPPGANEFIENSQSPEGAGD